MKSLRLVKFMLGVLIAIDTHSGANLLHISQLQ